MRFLCHRCWQRTRNAIALPVHKKRNIQQPAASLLVPNYRRTPNSANRCIFNNCQSQSRCRIPEVIKVHLLQNHKLYVPDSARVCQEHLIGNVWDDLPDFCDVLHDFTSAFFTDICEMLIRAVNNSKVLNFEVPGAISDIKMHFWTGRTNEQFDLILQETHSLNDTCRSPRLALGMYLIKLRTGESNARLGSQFHMSERSVRRILKKVRGCLQNEFVPQNLGFDHITRNENIERNLTIPKR